jgi:hypothetical protein
MKYYPLQPAPMQESGSSLLRLIQNDEMVPLDLLVRESVQNSLDAAIDPMKPVTVAFNVIAHFPDDVAGVLPEVSEGLKRKFVGKQTLLEIRDTGTQGLNGPLSLGDGSARQGNLVKLVYEISQPQEKKNAGGSWGLGKTVYYRMGAGIVFYYSRIKDGCVFEDRLAVCFVENERLAEKVMSSSRTGIAWWGGENIYSEGKEWPTALTSPGEIRVILACLGVKPFAADETGTSVIIPFLREALLPCEPANGDDEDDHLPYNAFGSSPWYGGVTGYIKYSLLRWYAVRLANDSYPLYAYGSKLEAFVNEDDVSRSLPPLFTAIQALYNRVYEEESSFGTCPEPLQEDILCDRIMLRGNTFDGDFCAGWIVATRLSREQLGMGAPDNEYSPFTHLLNRSDDTSCFPVIGYLRSPGMIVRWNDEKWQKILKGGSPDHYVIGIFVPYSSQLFTAEMAARTGCTSLEGYLRSIEKADHSSWADKAGLSIVHRISTNVQNKINAKFFPVKDEATEIRMDLGLARRLADAFLPAGFGQDSRNLMIPGGGGGGIHLANGTNPSFHVHDFRYLPGKIIMGWTLLWGRKKVVSHLFDLNVATIRLPISQEQWAKDTELGEFPFVFEVVTVNSVTPKKKEEIPGITMHLLPGEEGEDTERRIVARVADTAIEIMNISGHSMDSWTFGGTLAITVKKQDEDLVPVILLQSQGEEGGAQ